jgi:hypothetical protein
MTTSTRLAAAAAAAALLLGSAGAATAGTHAGAHGHAGDHGTHGGAAVSHLQKQLQRQIEVLGDRIDHATRESRLETLSDEVRTGVLANVATDHAALDSLSAAVDAATTRDELSDLRKQVRALHAQNYVGIVASLRQAVRLSAHIAELRTTLADDADALAQLDAADALVASATEKALAVTAASSRADVQAVHADLASAHDIVEALEAPVTP